jgi:periplasmic copper chaperone A
MQRIIAILFAAALAGSAQAADVQIGGLTIHDPSAKQSPKGADVGAAFMVIDNRGNADRLVAATADNADHVEIHEMAITDGVMKMREMPGGLDIPAGGKVELKPGSYHLMLMGLKQPIAAGATIKGTLTFERAGKVAVDFVTPPAAAK